MFTKQTDKRRSKQYLAPPAAQVNIVAARQSKRAPENGERARVIRDSTAACVSTMQHQQHQQQRAIITTSGRSRGVRWVRTDPPPAPPITVYTRAQQ